MHDLHSWPHGHVLLFSGVGTGGGGQYFTGTPPRNVEASKGIIACENGFCIHIPAIFATNFQAHAQVLISEISIVLYTCKKKTGICKCNVFVTQKFAPPQYQITSSYFTAVDESNIIVCLHEVYGLLGRAPHNVIRKSMWLHKP